MDHRGEALVGFVATHGDAFEFFEFAEEILDEMSPFVDFGVDGERLCAPWVLGDHDFCAPLVQLGDDRVGIESLVSQQATELDAFDKRRDPHRIKALAGH